MTDGLLLNTVEKRDPRQHQAEDHFTALCPPEFETVYGAWTRFFETSRCSIHCVWHSHRLSNISPSLAFSASGSVRRNRPETQVRQVLVPFLPSPMPLSWHPWKAEEQRIISTTISIFLIFRPAVARPHSSGGSSHLHAHNFKRPVVFREILGKWEVRRAGRAKAHGG